MAAHFGKICCSCLVLGIFLTQANGANILLMGMQQPSHLLELSATGIALVEKGHTVYRLVASSFVNKQRIQREGIVDIEFESAQRLAVPMSHPHKDKYFLEHLLTKEISIDFVRNTTGSMANDCEDALNDHKTLDRLRSLKLDLAIIDGLSVMYCSFLIPYVLRIPYVSQTAVLDFYMGGTPTLSSFVTPGSGIFPPLHSDKKTFIQRLQGFLFQSLVMANERYDINGVLSQKLLKLHAPELTGWRQLVFRSSLYFVLQDNALNWPQVTMPNVVITSMSRKMKIKTLLPQFDTLMNEQNSKGVIVVSFGSHGGVPPPLFAIKLMKAFSEFNYTFIWRLQVDEIYPPLKKIPSNVHVFSWLPQEDLLAHPRTRLFINHGGNGGQYEAIYHGVPMIVIPLFADQMFNGFGLEQRGCGILLELKTFQPADVVDAIERVLSNESFYENTRQRSLIVKDNIMTARQTTVFWIEHILKFGHEHLRSGALDLAWYEYYMIDVLLFIGIVTGLILLILFKLIKCIIC